MFDNNEILNTKEVSDLLGISTGTFRNMIRIYTESDTFSPLSNYKEKEFSNQEPYLFYYKEYK